MLLGIVVVAVVAIDGGNSNSNITGNTDHHRRLVCVPFIMAEYTAPSPPPYRPHQPPSSSREARDYAYFNRTIRGKQQQQQQQSIAPHHVAPMIRVGFLSFFFYHHSVGLLMQGVIKHLNRYDTTSAVLCSI